jgi:8-oxo-dGTP diphosphatase
MAVFLVRHAEAGDRHRWEGADEGRPLTARGEAQAEALVARLGKLQITRILSSPYLRCTRTVAPLAADRGLDVERSHALAEGAGRTALALVRLELDGPGLVLCTHGDVAEEVLDGLGISRSVETAKGATWILEPTSARYLPAPE